jgi:hypothetical protein
MPDFRSLHAHLASLPPLVPAPRELTDDPKLPGHLLPHRVDTLEHAARLADQRNWFARLCGNSPSLGKAGVFQYDAEASVGQMATVPFFEIGGSDLDSGQMTVTLDLPRVHAVSDADVDVIASTIGLQNVPSGQSNLELAAGNFPGDASPLAWPMFCCLIEWGTSMRTYALVDFRNGTQVKISGSWCRAFAIVPEDAVNAPGTSAAYVLRASIAPGWAHGGNAQRQVALGAITASERSTDVFKTPPHAVNVSALSTIAPPGITAGYITFYQSDDGTNPVGSYYVNSNQPGPFPVSNGGMYFTITDGTGTTVNWFATFGLSL